jgi:SAM-dependent methyltransferase
MAEYDASTYGERWADVYDEWVAAVWHTTSAEAVVPALVGLSGAGPALELGIGTGRVALELARHGVEVHGIDASQAMVDELRRKPGGDAIPVTVGDFADVGVEGEYRCVYVPFNTFFALLTQDDQVRCFRNVAAHLTPDGVFVLECFVPDLTGFRGGQKVVASAVSTDPENVGVDLDVTRLDPVNQRIDAVIMFLRDGSEIVARPVRLRFAYPGELDLMARLAGMRLRTRMGGWKGEPFSADSARHVSVYELDR